MAIFHRRVASVLAGAALLAGCSSSHTAASPTTPQPTTSPTPAIGLCSTIRLGSPADPALLESGCSDPDRRTIVVLNHTKCRSGSDFGTFDLKTAAGKQDQLFAYRGTWHSSKHEPDLYRHAFDECL